MAFPNLGCPQTLNIGHVEGSGAAELTKELTFVHDTDDPDYHKPLRFESALGMTTRAESQGWADDFITRMFTSMGVVTVTNGKEDDKFQGMVQVWDFKLITADVVVIDNDNHWSVVSSAEAATISGDMVKKAPSPCRVRVRADYRRKQNIVTFFRKDNIDRRSIVMATLQIPWNGRDTEMARQFRDASNEIYS
ncbi:hypothetical protein FB446DRAFT_100694 [Lentinula raphanica]|nr:hypothetical protein FB446DRAFT_100694 [Lentinula raphanica]